MQTYFNDMADFVMARAQGADMVMCNFDAEESDFVRFNQAAVRQAGRVTQRRFSLEVVQGRRHLRGTTTLSGDKAADCERLLDTLRALQDVLPDLPEDPFLNYSTEVHSSERQGSNRLGAASDMVPEVLAAGAGTDMVGIYASGDMYSGFANSLGQRNWHANHTFQVDWSLYHHADKAVKCSHAGVEWDRLAYQRKMERARHQLTLLSQPARTIDPGHYRVYLAPAALSDVLGLVAWTGFGEEEHRTKRTCLLHMVEAEDRLHSDVTIEEDTAHGAAPDFQSAGFIRPDKVSLIHQGEFRQCLISPRSAHEYDVITNGANDAESPESMSMAPGHLPQDDVLSTLDTGIYVNNLWYLNYSDTTSCRCTGMTRFATFWVEHGRIVAPLNVMRFDDTVYRMLGGNLMGLTRERELLLSDDTYGSRSTSSTRVPGALIDAVAFTL